MNTFYLAGPMSGYPKFNFPAFHAAAKALREHGGWQIMSPAEMDAESGVAKKAMQSESGNLADAGIKETWGDFLARDVKIIADCVDGIIFLPGWQRSRGARLEAFVGLLRDYFEFYAYTTHFGAEEITRDEVMQEIYNATR